MDYTVEPNLSKTIWLSRSSDTTGSVFMMCYNVEPDTKFIVNLDNREIQISEFLIIVGKGLIVQFSSSAKYLRIKVSNLLLNFSPMGSFTSTLEFKLLFAPGLNCN